MKRILLCCTFLLAQLAIQAQDVTGLWKNLDDDGVVKSYIEVYHVAETNRMHARVYKLLENATLRICEKCEGENKGKSLQGMDIFWNLKPDKKPTKWKKGRILDPKSGKTYDCKIELKKDNELHVRGYMKAPMFGKTHKWYRVSDEISQELLKASKKPISEQ